MCYFQDLLCNFEAFPGLETTSFITHPFIPFRFTQRLNASVIKRLPICDNVFSIIDDDARKLREAEWTAAFPNLGQPPPIAERPINTSIITQTLRKHGAQQQPRAQCEALMWKQRTQQR